MEYSYYRISTATLLGLASTVVLGVLLAVLLHRRTALPAARSFSTAAAAVSVAGVLLITLTPSGRGGTSACSFVVDGSVFAWLRGNQSTANVAMFVPVGVAVTLATRTTRLFSWSLLGMAALPVLIEAAQAVLPVGRACDVVDVFDNWWGAVIGALIGWISGFVRSAVAERRPALA